MFSLLTALGLSLITPISPTEARKLSISSLSACRFLEPGNTPMAHLCLESYIREFEGRGEGIAVIQVSDLERHFTQAKNIIREVAGFSHVLKSMEDSDFIAVVIHKTAAGKKISYYAFEKQRVMTRPLRLFVLNEKDLILYFGDTLTQAEQLLFD